MIVDVHAHCLPVAVRGNSRAGDVTAMRSMALSDTAEDIDIRIRRMDEAGVDRQVLMAGDTQYDADPDRAAAEARAINDALAQLARAHPARLSSYLCLPLPHIEPSLAELNRCLDSGHFVGVAAHCSVLEQSIADEQFDPIFQALDERRAVLFLHPVVNGACSCFVNDWGLAASVGTSIEDMLAVLHLIVRQAPHRYPNVKIIVPHLGGGLSTLLSRLDGQLPWAHPDLPEPPSTTARRFWYDTVAHGSGPALRCACEAFGADRLLTGSDYPFLPGAGYASTVDYIRTSGIDEESMDRIINRNAAELFGLTP